MRRFGLSRRDAAIGIVTACSILLCTVAASVCYGSELDGLVFELSVAADTVEHCTPILLTARAINHGADRGVSYLSNSGSYFYLTVLDKKGESVPILRGESSHVPGTGHPISLRQGDTLSELFDINSLSGIEIRNTMLPCLDIGTYRICARWYPDYFLKDRRFLTDTLNITVAQPRDVNRAAYELLIDAKTKDAGRSFNEAAAGLFRLYRNYSQSPYAERAVKELMGLTSWVLHDYEGQDYEYFCRLYVEMFPNGFGVRLALRRIISSYPDAEKSRVADSLLQANKGTYAAFYLRQRYSQYLTDLVENSGRQRE